MKLPGVAFALIVVAAAPGSVLAAGGDEPWRQERWEYVSGLIFGDRSVEAGGEVISIEAPARAQDAALVPITLRIGKIDGVRAVHLVIDENPVPYAAGIRFGPAGDPSELRLRVRIDGYTNIHAVAEMDDGQLLEAAAFVKGSGGCSAPVAANREEALADLGRMKLRFDADGDIASLMIRHPNFSGMQMDPATRGYFPARYLDDIRVSQGGEIVFELTGDISLSTDPVIGFVYDPAGGAIEVSAGDTDGSRWEGAFETPAAIN